MWYLINFSILSQSVPIFHVSLSSFIYYFCHITFYLCGSFSIFVRDFLFSSFPLTFLMWTCLFIPSEMLTFLVTFISSNITVLQCLSKVREMSVA